MKLWQVTGMVLGMALLALGHAGHVQAHEFRMIFIAPLSGAGAAEGQQALAGLMFAARERDGHPDETADGHLGGMDVHVLTVDSAVGRTEALKRIESLKSREPVEIVAGVLPAAWRETPPGLEQAAPMPFIDGHRVTPPQTTMDGTPFQPAFRTATGSDAGPWTLRGYGVGRLIDRAIRAVNEDLSKRDRLMEILKAGMTGG